jgi:1-deoxy-D-xylulose-5-phosphate synthase
VRVVNPLDPAMLEDACGHPLIVTVEDGMRVGGAGSHMADALAALSPGRRCPPVLNLGTPLEFIPHGAPEGILAQLGLDGDGVAGSVRRALQDADSYS